jgi:hypothetical protein
LLVLARSEDVSLFSSLPLLAELTGILSISKFEKKIAASQLSVDQLVDLYAGVVALVRPISTPPNPAPSPQQSPRCAQKNAPFEAAESEIHGLQ